MDNDKLQYNISNSGKKFITKKIRTLKMSRFLIPLFLAAFTYGFVFERVPHHKWFVYGVVTIATTVYGFFMPHFGLRAYDKLIVKFDFTPSFIKIKTVEGEELNINYKRLVCVKDDFEKTTLTRMDVIVIKHKWKDYNVLTDYFDKELKEKLLTIGNE